MRADPGGEPAAAAARELLGEHGVVEVVAALAAVLLGVLQAEEAEPASLVKTSLGNQRSSSHSSAWGRSSAAMKRRIDSRSSSCSSVNGGVAGIAARTYLDTSRFARYTGRDVIRSVEQTSLHAPQLYERIASRLADDVRSGALAPGERLPGERELARRLGVGRASVREALGALQVRGIVETRRARLLRRRRRAAPLAAREAVPPPTPGRRPARGALVLEPAHRRAAAAARAGRDPECDRLLEVMDASADLRTRRSGRWNDADRRFHRRLAALTGNPVLLALAEHVAALMDQPLWQRLRDDSIADARPHALQSPSTG